MPDGWVEPAVGNVAYVLHTNSRGEEERERCAKFDTRTVVSTSRWIISRWIIDRYESLRPSKYRHLPQCSKPIHWLQELDTLLSIYSICHSCSKQMLSFGCTYQTIQYTTIGRPSILYHNEPNISNNYLSRS